MRRMTTDEETKPFLKLAPKWRTTGPVGERETGHVSRVQFMPVTKRRRICRYSFSTALHEGGGEAVGLDRHFNSAGVSNDSRPPVASRSIDRPYIDSDLRSGCLNCVGFVSVCKAEQTGLRSVTAVNCVASSRDARSPVG